MRPATRITVAIACAVVIGVATLGFGEAAEAFELKAKTIQIICFGTPGDGWDTGARSTAITLTKILPGNPRVLVRNVPGGEGDRALRLLAAPQTPRDGTVISPVHGRWFVADLLGKPHPNYDPDEQLVAALRKRTVGHSLFAWRDVATSWDQIMAMKTPLTMGAGDRGGGEASSGGPLLASMLGAPIKILWGFGPSSPERSAAFFRHEVDLFGGMAILRHFPELLEQKKVVPVLYWGELGPLDFPEWADLMKAAGVTKNPPHLFDAMKVPKDMQTAFTAATEATAIHRGSYVVPPGTPTDIRDFWAKTLAEVPKDPKWRERLLAAGISPTDIGYATREEVLAMRNEVKALGPEAKKAFIAFAAREK